MSLKKKRNSHAGDNDATLSCAAKPDRMFDSPPSALAEVSAAWWGHFKYIIVGALLITSVLYSIIHSIKEKCSQGLTLEVFKTQGQSEVRFFLLFFPVFPPFLKLILASRRASGDSTRSNHRSNNRRR